MSFQDLDSKQLPRSAIFSIPIPLNKKYSSFMKLFSHNIKVPLIAQYYPTLQMEVKWFKVVQRCLNNHRLLFINCIVTPQSRTLHNRKPPVIHKWDE